MPLPAYTIDLPLEVKQDLKRLADATEKTNKILAIVVRHFMTVVCQDSHSQYQREASNALTELAALDNANPPKKS